MNGATQAFELAGVLADERRAVDLAVVRARSALATEAPAAIAPAIVHALDTTGKRIRPILCVAAYRAVRGDRGSDVIYDAAAALELVHTYSLVHDDLPCMDDDDLRRGRPTTHRVHGSTRAMLAGAALIPFACALLARAGERLELDPRSRGRLVRELAAGAGAGGMVGGQWLDLEAEGSRIDAARLHEIAGRKTGALFEAAARMGGVAARADDETIAALGAFGRGVGLAFQIADDLLDVTGDATVLGKRAGRDDALAKATFPALLGIDEARARAELAARDAIRALDRGGIGDALLRALARFAIERNR